MRSLIELDQLCGVFAVPPTLSTPNAFDLEVDFAGKEPRVRKVANSASTSEGLCRLQLSSAVSNPSLNRTMTHRGQWRAPNAELRPDTHLNDCSQDRKSVV